MVSLAGAVVAGGGADELSAAPTGTGAAGAGGGGGGGGENPNQFSSSPKDSL